MSSGTPSDLEDPTAADAEVSELLTSAGFRPVPSAAARAAAKQAVHVAWRKKVDALAAQRRRRLQTWSLAAAALLAVAVGAFYLLQIGSPVPSADAGLATVEEVWELADLTVGTHLGPGGELETGDSGRAALRLAAGQSLRLDVSTRVRFLDQGVLALDRGAVYLDSDAALPDAALEVRTPFGVARDVGTQFSVRLFDEELRLQVREGAVDVAATSGERYPARAGEALTVRADGTGERTALPPYGAAWQWILETSPPFELEGATVAGMLTWVARETGWRVTYADEDLAAEAATIVIHSSVAGLRPDQAPALILPPSGLDSQFQDGVLVISRAARSR